MISYLLIIMTLGGSPLFVIPQTDAHNCHINRSEVEHMFQVPTTYRAFCFNVQTQMLDFGQ